MTAPATSVDAKRRRPTGPKRRLTVEHLRNQHSTTQSVLSFAVCRLAVYSKLMKPADAATANFIAHLAAELRAMMTATDLEFDGMVAGFYRAAAGHIPWEEALRPVRQTLSAFAIYLHGVDVSKASVVFSHVSGEVKAESELDYIREYHQIDPRTDLVLSRPVGQWMNCWEHFDNNYVAQSRFYQEFLIPYGGRYVCGTKVFEDDSLSVMVGFHRGATSPHLDSDEVLICQRLAWHLGQAFELHRSQIHLRTEGRLGIELLARVRTPLLLLDEERSILHANPAAQTILKSSSVIEERSGRLHCKQPKDDGELLIALLKMLREDEAHVGSATVEKMFMRARARLDDTSLGLYLYTLRPRQTLYAFGQKPLAMLVIHKPGMLEYDPFLVATAFDLTPAEARVAVASANGFAADEIARQHAVAVSTIRTQLRSVFQKTGVVRQTQLVGMLSSLPGIIM